MGPDLQHLVLSMSMLLYTTIVAIPSTRRSVISLETTTQASRLVFLVTVVTVMNGGLPKTCYPSLYAPVLDICT